NVGEPITAVAAPLAATGPGPRADGVALPSPAPLPGRRASAPAGLRLGAASTGAASHHFETVSKRPAARRGARIAAALPSSAVGPHATRPPAPGPAGPRSARHGIPVRGAERRRGGAPGGGFDAGWLVACVGLVGAATALGRPARTARSVRRSFAPERPAIGSSQPATR